MTAVPQTHNSLLLLSIVLGLTLGNTLPGPADVSLTSIEGTKIFPDESAQKTTTSLGQTLNNTLPDPAVETVTSTAVTHISPDEYTHNTTTTSYRRDIGTYGKNNGLKIVFQKYGELNISPSQMIQFLQCLCDNNSKNCFMFTSESKAIPNTETSRHKVTEVRTTLRAQDNVPSNVSLQNITSSYTCSFFFSKLVGVLFCADEDNATFRFGEKSSVVKQPAADFYTSCDFEIMTLLWKTAVKYFNFGQGPVTVKDNKMTFSFSKSNGHRLPDIENDDTKDVTTSSGTIDNEDDLIDFRNILEGTVKDSEGTTADEKAEKDNKKINNNNYLHWYAARVNKNPKLLVALFILSLVINVILLLICIYLFIDKRRNVDRRISTLPPIFFSEQSEDDKQISIGEPVNDTLDTSYEDVCSEGVRGIKLKLREDGGYLTPKELQDHPINEEETSSPKANGKNNKPSRSSQEFEDVNLSDNDQKPANYRSIGKEDNVRQSHTYANLSDNVLRPKTNITEEDTGDGNDSPKIAPGSGITRRREILSAFFKSPFNRPRFHTHATDGTDPNPSSRDQVKASEIPADRGEKDRNRASWVKSRFGKNHVNQITAPRKPRRSRENFPRLTNDTSQYRQTSKTIPAPATAAPEEEIYQNNMAFTSAESDENVFKYMRDRTSSLYCNL